MRKIAGLVAQRSVERLQMQRHRVINRTADFSLVQNLRKRVTPLDANRVLVEHMFITFRYERRRNARNAQQKFCVRLSMRLPRTLPFRQVAQFHAQNSRLDFIEAAVPSWLAANVFCGLAVISQRF
jgi:hypothetical protein